MLLPWWQRQLPALAVSAAASPRMDPTQQPFVDHSRMVRCLRKHGRGMQQQSAVARRKRWSVAVAGSRIAAATSTWYSRDGENHNSTSSKSTVGGTWFEGSDCPRSLHRRGRQQYGQRRPHHCIIVSLENPSWCRSFAASGRRRDANHGDRTGWHGGAWGRWGVHDREGGFGSHASAVRLLSDCYHPSCCDRSSPCRCGARLPFGGVKVVLADGFGQLPPVAASGREGWKDAAPWNSPVHREGEHGSESWSSSFSGHQQRVSAPADGWMDGMAWMDGMDGWMDGRTDGQTDR